MTGTNAARPSAQIEPQRVALVDLLDRVLAKGVVVSGEVILSIADVDLVRVSLQALVSSVRAQAQGPLRDAAMVTDKAHQPEEG